MSSQNSSMTVDTKFALVAFKETLATNIYPVTELKGPKMKVAGATVKVYDDGFLQKGTIVITTDNLKWLVNESERFNVARYFGLSTSPVKNCTPSKRFSTPRRTSVVNFSRYDSPSPIMPRLHSTMDNRPLRNSPLIYDITNEAPRSRRHSTIDNRPLRNAPLTYDIANEAPRSRRTRTTVGLHSSTPIALKNKKQEKGKIGIPMKLASKSSKATNKNKDTSSRLTQKRITDFFQVQEKKQLEGSSFLYPEQNISAFLASYDYLFQQPRSVALQLCQEETSTSNSFTTVLPPTPNDYLTPMEIFSGILWDMEHCRLNEPWTITTESLKEVKAVSKTPAVFARNLMYRMFTIGELKARMMKGCLDMIKMKLIQKLTVGMFVGVEVNWSDCVLLINDSVRYPVLLAHC